MRHSDIRAELESSLKSPLSEMVWEYLWEESYINGIEMGDYTIPDVARAVRRLHHTFGQSVPEPGDAPLMLDKETNLSKINSSDERLRAISVLLAQDAKQDPLVVAIRTSVLHSRLLEPEEAEDWIKRQAATDGKPTRLLNSVPLPPEAEVQQEIGTGLLFTDPPIVIDRDYPVSGIRLQTLSYGVPEDCWQRFVPITVGGVLGKAT
jgi:hypothetical protein